MIKFNCAKCLRSLQSGDSNAGKSLRCPSCSELITVPLLLAVVESPEEKLTDPDAFVLSVLNPEPDGSDTRKCQYCAETIKADAIKCRFCGEIVRQISESSLGVSGVGEEPTIYGKSINSFGNDQPIKVSAFKLLGGIGCIWAAFLILLIWFLTWLVTGVGGVPLLIVFCIVVILLIVLRLLI